MIYKQDVDYHKGDTTSNIPQVDFGRKFHINKEEDWIMGMTKNMAKMRHMEILYFTGIQRGIYSYITRPRNSNPSLSTQQLVEEMRYSRKFMQGCVVTISYVKVWSRNQ